MVFDYTAYTRLVRGKLLEIVPKKIVTFAASPDPQRRRYFWERLGCWPSAVRRLGEQGPVVVVHANALGEVLACRGLLHDLKAAYPQVRILITTMNFDGDTQAACLPEADAVVFLPYDHPACIRRAMDRARPRALLVLESDWWPNLVRVATERGVPVAGVSAAFRSERPFYNHTFACDEAIFRHVAFLGVQSEADAERFMPLASPSCRLVVTGPLKADRRFFRLDPEAVEGWRHRLQLEAGEPVVVAGSLREPEEATVLEAFGHLRAELGRGCLIVAPRYLEQVPGLVAKAEARGLPARRVSRLPGPPRAGAPALVLDTYGDLHEVYAVGTVAVIGGSLLPLGPLVGGQNPLEPATHGVPVVFGPHMEHFRSLADLFLARGAARQAHDGDSLTAALRDIVHHPETRGRMAAAAAKLLEEQARVTAQTLEALRPLLDRVILPKAER
ncbi:MAG: 3-deoxy-D-manno-octulosonic acid transferase [Nitrospinota bacterium]